MDARTKKSASQLLNLDYSKYIEDLITDNDNYKSELVFMLKDGE